MAETTPRVVEQTERYRRTTDAGSLHIGFNRSESIPEPYQLQSINGVEITVDFNSKKTATRRRDDTFRNGPKRSSGRTFFPFTSIDLKYPENPTSHRLYSLVYIRISVPEIWRISRLDIAGSCDYFTPKLTFLYLYFTL